MSTPTSRELEAIKSLKQIAREEFILPGTAVCGGCGGLEALRLAAKAIGPKTVFVNAAGCFTLLATFPYTPFKCSWLYTTMASAAAGAQGVSVTIIFDDATGYCYINRMVARYIE